MDDSEELFELCKQSIEERIKCMKVKSYGFGYGKSTQLKHLICKLTDLPFALVRFGLDSFDEAQGWDIDNPKTKSKWYEFYYFLHPNSKKYKGDFYYIQEFGHLYKVFLEKWIYKMNNCPCGKPDNVEYYTMFVCHNCNNEKVWKKD